MNWPWSKQETSVITEELVEVQEPNQEPPQKMSAVFIPLHKKDPIKEITEQHAD